MNWLFLLLFATVIAGQLLRLPVGDGTGLLALDAVVFGVVGVWIVQKLLFDRTNPFPMRYGLPFFGFLAVALFSLLLAIPHLPNTNEVLISAFYWVRFLMYGMLFFVAMDQSKKKTILYGFLGTGFFLSVLGFLQLKVFPSFKELRMYEMGWDPHEGRLLSTWFDPNFLGGFFTLVAAVILGILIMRFRSYVGARRTVPLRGTIGLAAVLCVILAALLLTYSRSAYLAFLIAGGILGLLASRSLILIGVLILSLGLAVSPRAQERVSGAVDSAKAIFSDSSIIPADATARLRFDSWQNGVNIWKENPIIGAGFNTLRYELTNRGLVSEKSHAASGIDASFLTVLATTGILGAFCYFWFWGVILFDLLKRWERAENLDDRGIALGLFAGTLGVFGNAIFVNSLFFPFLLAPLFVILGFVLRKTR